MTLVYTLRRLHEASPEWVRRAEALAGRSLPVRWRYGPAFRHTWDLLRQQASWSPEERAGYQRQELRRVLAFAGERVPYYRRVFAATGFDPSRAEISDLRRLPVLTREDVARLGHELLPDGRPPAESKYSTTGGTTGKPLGFWITHDASAAEWAFMMWGWRRAGFRPGSRRVVVRGRVVSGRRKGRLLEADWLNDALYVSSFDLNAETLPACVAAIRRYRPRFFHAFPSSATVVAQYLERSGERLPSLEALLLGSENIYPGQRDYLERVFACRVFTWYGHSEKSIFAPACSCGRSYVPEDAYGVTEIVDAAGDPIVEAGRPGLLVGTGFINAGTVFIRYLTDDQAEWVGGQCPGCGATGPLLANIVGRWNQEFLVGRSGALLPMSAVNLHSRVYTAVRQFQFVQEAAGKAILRAVRAAGFSADDDLALRRELDERIGGEIAFGIEYVSELPLTSAGKFKFVDQRLVLEYPSWPSQAGAGNTAACGRLAGSCTSTTGEHGE